MHRAAVSVFLLLVALGAAACGDHEAEPTLPTFDFTPVATIAVGDDSTIGCLVQAVTTGCEVASGSVLSVENEGETDHRLVGTTPSGGNVFDTGVMQPGDAMTLVLSADGIVTVTDELAPDGDAPTLDITVTPTPADS